MSQHRWDESAPLPNQVCSKCGGRRVPLGRAATSAVLLQAEESICPISDPAPETTRPTWDETWMAVADTMSLRSLCEGRQVGAVIVDRNNRPVSTGYNGPPQGYPTGGESCGRWCQRQMDRLSGTASLSYGLSCPTVHAEANALMFADRRDYEGGTIYVTAACCQDCIKMVANSGVARLVMRLGEIDSHRDPHASIDFARTCGLDVRTVE